MAPTKTADWIAADEARERLGVRPQTLYAYVSRGRVQVRPDPRDPRRSLYRAADIAALSERKSRSRKPAEVAAGGRELVRLVERLPIVPLPAWRDFRTQPIDGRDVLAFLARAATSEAAAGRSLDIAGPDVLTYGEMVTRIADLMHVGRPPIRLGFNATALTSRVAAAVAGETHELIGPLMAGLEGDLLPREDHADALLGVRLHRFEAAVERILWRPRR